MGWQACLKQSDLNHLDWWKWKGRLAVIYWHKSYHHFDKKQIRRQALWALEHM